VVSNSLKHASCINRLIANGRHSGSSLNCIVVRHLRGTAGIAQGGRRFFRHRKRLHTVKFDGKPLLHCRRIDRFWPLQTQCYGEPFGSINAVKNFRRCQCGNKCLKFDLKTIGWCPLDLSFCESPSSRRIFCGMVCEDCKEIVYRQYRELLRCLTHATNSCCSTGPS
jgi:hypothetical protein